MFVTLARERVALNVAVFFNGLEPPNKKMLQEKASDLYKLLSSLKVSVSWSAPWISNASFFSLQLGLNAGKTPGNSQTFFFGSQVCRQPLLNSLEG